MYVPILSRSSTGILGTPTKPTSASTMLLRPISLARARWQILTLLLVSIILLTNIYKGTYSLADQIISVHDVQIQNEKQNINHNKNQKLGQDATASGNGGGLDTAGSRKDIISCASNIPPLIHQNYFLVPESGSVDAHAVDAYHASSYSSSWQNTPFAYNFYSESAARALLPLLAEKLPRDAKFKAEDYMRVWDSLPLGMLRADFWRYIVLFLYGGVYVDLDVELRAELPWGALCEEKKRISRVEGRRLKDKKEEIETQLIVGIEGDNTMSGLSRGLQIVSWTIASAPSHPAALCAMEHVITTSPSFLARHEKEGDIERYIMDWTGPGVWTDCVLDWLNSHRQRGDDLPVEDTLHALEIPRKVHDTLVLPRAAFAVLQGMKDGVDDGVLVKHYFEGMWKSKWSGRLWKNLFG